MGSATRLLRAVIEIAVVYVAAGAIYKSYATGARGLECIPHLGLWVQYPGLVQDGVRYAHQMVLGEHMEQADKSVVSRPASYVRTGSRPKPECDSFADPSVL